MVRLLRRLAGVTLERDSAVAGDSLSQRFQVTPAVGAALRLARLHLRVPVVNLHETETQALAVGLIGELQ